jgi:hypothetical protein
MSVQNTSRQLVQIEAQRAGWTVFYPPKDPNTDYYQKGDWRIRVVYNRAGVPRFAAIRPWRGGSESWLSSATRANLIKELRREVFSV